MKSNHRQLAQRNHSAFQVSNNRLDGSVNLTAYKRVAYFQMDAQSELRLGQVDGRLSSHIILASARLDSHGNIILMRQEDLAHLEEAAQFKRHNPQVRLMISIANEMEHNGLQKAAMNSENRQRFSRSAMDFLQRFSLDGIDLDWQFSQFPPLNFMGREQERIGLTKICSSLRSAIVENFFDRQVTEQHQLQARSHSISSNTMSSIEPYLLSVAIAGQESSMLRSNYEFRQLCNLCDWLNVMSFDYYLFKPYAPFTGPNSPLYSIVDPFVPILSKFSLACTLSRLLIDEKVPPEKIVMGIPTYGRAYKLMFKSNQPTPFSLAIGSKPGERNEQHLNFGEICDILTKPETVVEFDQRARVPYLLTDDGYTWITYEDTQSVREKVRFITENNLAGYMVWSLNYDDFTVSNKITQQMLADCCADAAAADDAKANGSKPTDDEKVSFPLHRAMLDELITQHLAGGAK